MHTINDCISILRGQESRESKLLALEELKSHGLQAHQLTAASTVDPAVARDLLELFEHNPDYRCYLATLLGSIANTDEEAFAELRVFANSADKDLRESAISAISESNRLPEIKSEIKAAFWRNVEPFGAPTIAILLLGDAQAREMVVAMIFEATNAAESAGSLFCLMREDEQAVEQLCNLITHDNRIVAAAAARAVAGLRQKAQSALPRLKELLQSRNESNEMQLICEVSNAIRNIENSLATQEAVE